MEHAWLILRESVGVCVHACVSESSRQAVESSAGVCEDKVQVLCVN